MKTFNPFIVICALFSFGMVCFASDITREFKVSNSPSLILGNIAGDIEVRPGPSDRIKIHVNKDNDDIEVEMFQSRNRVTVKVRYPSRNNYGNRGDVDFLIEFPAEGKSLELKSISGGIEVKGISCDMKLHTVSGDVSVEKCQGNLKLNAVSGDIELDEIGPSSIDASTISGDVDYSNGRLDGGDYSFSSTSGNVVLAHKKAAAYQISGRTISGSINNRVGDGIKVKVAKYSGMQSVSGNFNGGGVWVETNTVSGDIVIEID